MKTLGLFLERANILLPRIKKIPVVLEIQLFEVNLLLAAITNFLQKNIKFFDPLSVGDSKCQTRASLLLDIYENKLFTEINIFKEKQKLIETGDRLFYLLKKFDFNNYLEIKNIMSEVNNLSMYEIFDKYELNLNLSYELKFIGKCFLLTLNNEQINDIAQQKFSGQKINSVLSIAKKSLSLLSLKYEQLLAKQYSSLEVQKVLSYIITNNYHKITAFYPSFLPIFEKIKYKQQIILQNNIFFCDCGGIKDIKFTFFKYKNDKFEEVFLLDKLNELVFVIQGYQFNTSFSKLKLILNIDANKLSIPQENMKLCFCNQKLDKSPLYDFSEAILANFAQHEQFTNEAEIPWTDLGLENSQLKKEYDRLRALSGYSLDDMSKFCIRHIYPSTVGQELEDQRQFLAKLGKK